MNDLLSLLELRAQAEKRRNVIRAHGRRLYDEGHGSGSYDAHLATVEAELERLAALEDEVVGATQ